MSPRTGAIFMRVVAIVFGVYAVLWGLAPFPEVNLPARVILDLSDWPIDNLASPLDRNTTWLVSIAAGLLAALAIFLGLVVAPAIEQGDREIVKATVYAFLVWYAIDGIGSYASGVTSNIAFNTLYLVLAMLPLILTRSQHPPRTQRPP